MKLKSGGEEGMKEDGLVHRQHQLPSIFETDPAVAQAVRSAEPFYPQPMMLQARYDNHQFLTNASFTVAFNRPQMFLFRAQTFCKPCLACLARLHPTLGSNWVLILVSTFQRTTSLPSLLVDLCLVLSMPLLTLLPWNAQLSSIALLPR